MKKLFLLALLITVFAKAVVAQTPIDAADKAILMNIYNSAGGAGWTNKDNWGTNNYPWYGVEVDGNTGRVTQLSLYNNNLIGTLPAINGLTALAQFSCAQNQLSGTIPSLSGLTSLSHFECYSNQFTGEIPSLSGLTQLWSFSCSNNQFTGSIPSLSGLTSLAYFSCSDNKLTGSIPSLSGMTSLTKFECANNQLTGSIPSLSGLTSLVQFSCAQNQLNGTIPSLSGLTGLYIFECSSNQFTGEIPSLSGLTQLWSFSCSNNQLTGSIPSLSGLTSLAYFYCSDNKLTGSIPSLSGMTSLENFECANNRLTGTIPSLSGLTALATFGCSNNQLTGSIPSLSGLTALKNFSCSDNQLTGYIPSFSGLTSLVNFACSNNQLIGSIPLLSGLAALEGFRCSNNKLSGISDFEKPASLTAFEIHYTNINYSVLDGLSSGFQTFIKTQELSFYSPQNVPVTLNQAGGIVSSNRAEGGAIEKITYKWFKQTGATQDPGNDELIATKTGANSYKLSAGATTGDNVYAVISHADWTQQGVDNKDLYFTTNTITVLQPLPVTFGAFEATLKDGQLIVNWQTLTENNCAYYEVQVSNDGNKWHTIQTIQSKAHDGNSSATLHYEYSTPISKIALGLSILACFTLGFFKQNTSPGNSTNTLAKKGIKIAGFLAIITLVISCSISCNKKDSATIAVTKEKVFVRIVQVDKDGTRVIGKVIQAVKE